MGIAIMLLVVGISPAPGYEIETHAALSEAATTQSRVDRTLKQSLGITNGIDEKVADKRLLEWIQEGSRREDHFPRFLNHFHNPLVDWWQAGLDGSGGGQSAIVWAQNTSQCSAPGPNQCVPNWAWQNARQYFLDALTRPQKNHREAALANLFEGLGRQMHLIQDAGSPAHTRNDRHVFYNYEKLVDKVRDTESGQFGRWLAVPPPGFGALRPDPGWQSLPANVLAQLPIARLLDTDRYTGGNPWVGLDPLMGLSEYTNANFFSEDSAFAENKTSTLDRFPYPSRTSVIATVEPIVSKTGETVNRIYYHKIADGDTNYRLATVGFFRHYLELFNLTPGRQEKPALDDHVYRDYAPRLLPRAVGYSAALLDYFFRGTLDVDLVADPVDSSRLKLAGSNGATSDELVAGTLALYWDDASGVRGQVPGFVPLSLAGVKPGDLISSPSFLPPAGAERFVAVYEGALGQEQGAVIGKIGVGDGGVEELFIDDATGDLYFRNRSLVTRLNVREQLAPAGASIGRVIWGNDGVSFMVSVGPCRYGCTYDWAIFELSPRPGKHLTWRTPPIAGLVRQEPFDVTWTAAGGEMDEVFTIVLDSRRHVLYGGHRGPINNKAAVLVDQSQRTTLRNYGIAIAGVFGGGSVPYIVYADGADLAASVVVVKSFAYLDDPLQQFPVPFRISAWVGSVEYFLQNDELIEHFGASNDPVWPHSTRRHLLYSVRGFPVTRVYLYDVKTRVSRIVAQDDNSGYYPTRHLDLVAKYDFRGSASTGVDRLFQASAVNLLDGTALPGDEREQFFAAWDKTAGTPLLDVTAAGYPPIDTAGQDLAKLMPRPAGLTPRAFSSPVDSRALQVVE